MTPKAQVRHALHNFPARLFNLFRLDAEARFG